MRNWLWAVAALLSACGTVDYEGAPAGRFDGSLLVMWVGEGDPGAGDGEFVFVPSPTAPLTFTRARGSVREIRPGIMYSDGGSVPRVAQVFQGFSPWGYAPAYMIHDWLFFARKCLNDGMATPAQAALAPVSFAESAAILAEAIKGLIAARKVRPNDVAPELISAAVAGPVSRGLWRAEGDCAGLQVSEAHLAEIRAALPGVLGAPVGAAPPGPRAGAARVVSVVSF